MTRSDLAPYLVRADATLREAVERLDAVRGRLVVVVDENGRLKGTLTDGDVRRALLRMTPMDAGVETAMNADPVAGRRGEDPVRIEARVQKRGADQAPLVDRDGRVTGLYPEHFAAAGARDNLVVIMAGGAEPVWRR